MKIVADYLVIALWWTSMICVSLSMFRIKIASYWPSILISVILLSQISYVIQSFKIIYVIAVIQSFSLFLCFLLIFKLNWVYSSIMVIISYSIAGVFETIFNWVLSGNKISRFIEIFREEYFIQYIALSVFNSLIVYMLKKYRLGFTFIHPTIVRPIPQVTLALLLMSLIFIASPALSLYFFQKGVIFTFGSQFILLLIVFHLAFKKEMSD